MMIKKRFKLKRNMHDGITEMLNRQDTVCSDSVFTSPAGTAKLLLMNGRLRDGVFHCMLLWETRETWRKSIECNVSGKMLTFDIYKSASHKYWLRGLIRRCR